MCVHTFDISLIFISVSEAQALYYSKGLCGWYINNVQYGNKASALFLIIAKGNNTLQSKSTHYESKQGVTNRKSLETGASSNTLTLIPSWMNFSFNSFG